MGTSERKVAMGDLIKFERLTSIFLHAFPSSFKHCPVEDVAAGKAFAEDLYYNFDNLPWKGSVKTNVFTRADPILGRDRWKEYKITLTNDGFLFLEQPRLLLGLEPLAETTTHHHHSKSQTRSKWYIIDREDLADPALERIFDFARNWFRSAEFEVLAFLTLEAQVLDLEFYHMHLGVVLTVQFEVGFPEGEIDPSWFVSRKKTVQPAVHNFLFKKRVGS